MSQIKGIYCLEKVLVGILFRRLTNQSFDYLDLHLVFEGGDEV